MKANIVWTLSKIAGFILIIGGLGLGFYLKDGQTSGFICTAGAGLMATKNFGKK